MKVLILYKCVCVCVCVYESYCSLLQPPHCSQLPLYTLNPLPHCSQLPTVHSPPTPTLLTTPTVHSPPTPTLLSTTLHLPSYTTHLYEASGKQPPPVPVRRSMRRVTSSPNHSRSPTPPDGTHESLSLLRAAPPPVLPRGKSLRRTSKSNEVNRTGLCVYVCVCERERERERVRERERPY